MSKPASNPFFEADFSKFADMSKIMGDFKFPFYDTEALMSTYRRNLEAFAAVNQAAIETAQTLARRQTEMVRQGFEEATGLINAVLSSPTPEEKVMRQAEASKAAVEKYIATARDFTDTVSKYQTKALETVGTRVTESVEELRGIMKNGKAAA
jgi:phasin family protein